ncbi:transcriptional repressor [Mycolicibacterium pulveris]|uniref:Transcriptional regulator FurA n=1 Tax=Mycolicibacterium pulveris TaxID=36813 RepID=A0A7I7UM19_MYCPV|nr:Fur family transcriptional regulator [Mycolicibacterium pulveris]MCV6979391.1 transcriptional repressor [Mycolicibacterium pulveris]BBY81166.1 transcriptional regulator FurA [Mycolicibacterium pulveris]
MQSAKDKLRAAGLRVTRPRLAVLAELENHPHADVETIATGARARLGAVSTQAIYDVVHALTRAGLLRRVEPAGSRTLFEIETGDNHHHLVCRSCGVIVDVACATGEAPCLQASDDRNFSIDEAEVTYWGLCPACRAVSTETTN